MGALEVDQTKSGNWAQKIRNIFAIAEDDDTPIAEIVEKIESKKDVLQYINEEKWKALKDKIAGAARLDQLLEMLPDTLSARAKNQVKSKLKKVAEQKLSEVDLVTKINSDADLKALFDPAKWGAFETAVSTPVNPIPVNPTKNKLTASIIAELESALKKTLGKKEQKKYQAFKEDAQFLQQASGRSVEELIERIELNSGQNLFKKKEYAEFKAKYNIA